MTEKDYPTCPKCGNNNPEMLDWRIDDQNNFVWECFECEHIWTATR